MHTIRANVCLSLILRLKAALHLLLVLELMYLLIIYLPERGWRCLWIGRDPIVEAGTKRAGAWGTAQYAAK